jgi:hypothetical protein
MWTKDFSEFIGLLNENKVEYLVVGGYAVSFHGYPRYTGDLDIWFNPEPENVKKLLNVLDAFGFSSLRIQKEDLIKPGNIIQLGYPPIRIDLLNDIDGVDFSSGFSRREISTSGDLWVNFISLQDLLVNKKATGRHRDLDDLQNLQPKQ